MTNPVISIVTKDSATVFVAGRPFIIESDNPRYADLVAAIGRGDHDAVDGIVNASERLTKALGQYGDVSVYAGVVTFQGRQVHNHLVDRILQMVSKGRDPGPYALFLDRVMRNPTKDAIQMLFDWVERAQLPILPDGRFLAYRYVRSDYLDAHSRTMDNTPGRIIELPREQCDTNYNNTCSQGLHFCNHKYLGGGSTSYRCLIMAEDPADVVSFPQDSGGQKGRTQRHEALFEISYEDAAKGIFFEGEDQLVFGWDRVAHYQREGLKLAAPEAQNWNQFWLDAWDAGWRVRWNREIGDEGAAWEVLDPNGLVQSNYDTRLEALDEMAEAYQADIRVDAAVAAAEVVLTDEQTETFAGRLDRLENHLGIPDKADTFTLRLDRIEVELGLSPGAPPQIDRLVRAEKVAGF